MRPPLEVADIFRSEGEAYRAQHKGHLSGIQLRAMRAIERCRTAALGGHLEECDHCGHRKNAYNSCRNRNCPKCLSAASKRWLQKRKAEVLPVPYVHVVFTVPEEIAKLAHGNQRAIYTILFRCVSETLLQIGRERKYIGGQLGFLAILHTWGQNLRYHPHIHCVVAGGGLARDGQWIKSRTDFFLPVAVLSKLFRGKFLIALNRAFKKGALRFQGKLVPLNIKSNFDRYVSVAAKKNWIVYCKPPFGGPQQVLRYLGRYTHRIAISNHRLISFTDGNVTFRWRDYRDGGRNKLMTLKAEQFIFRFLMHVVPARFVRIRHYGFLSNRNRANALCVLQQRLKPNTDLQCDSDNDDIRDICPICKIGKMVRIAVLIPIEFPDSS